MWDFQVRTDRPKRSGPMEIRDIDQLEMVWSNSIPVRCHFGHRKTCIFTPFAQRRNVTNGPHSFRSMPIGIVQCRNGTDLTFPRSAPDQTMPKTAKNSCFANSRAVKHSVLPFYLDFNPNRVPSSPRNGRKPCFSWFFDPFRPLRSSRTHGFRLYGKVMMGLPYSQIQYPSNHPVSPLTPF